jgi:hypothetical protein
MNLDIDVKPYNVRYITQSELKLPMKWEDFSAICIPIHTIKMISNNNYSVKETFKGFHIYDNEHGTDYYRDMPLRYQYDDQWRVIYDEDRYRHNNDDIEVLYKQKVTLNVIYEYTDDYNLVMHYRYDEQYKEVDTYIQYWCF